MGSLLDMARAVARHLGLVEAKRKQREVATKAMEEKLGTW